MGRLESTTNLPGKVWHLGLKKRGKKTQCNSYRGTRILFEFKTILFLALSQFFELTSFSCFHGSVLCSVLMYDLKLRNSTPTRSPNRKQFVSKVLPKLAGLQELAREKEMGGSDLSVANAGDIEEDLVKDESRDSDDRKEAIKRLKTSEYFCLEFKAGRVSRLFRWADSSVGLFDVRSSIGRVVG